MFDYLNWDIEIDLEINKKLVRLTQKHLKSIDQNDKNTVPTPLIAILDYWLRHSENSCKNLTKNCALTKTSSNAT